MMKKILEIAGDVEKHLVTVFDQALKNAGYAIKNSIDFIERAIKLHEEPSSSPGEKKE